MLTVLEAALAKIALVHGRADRGHASPSGVHLSTAEAVALGQYIEDVERDIRKVLKRRNA
jgi:hypothetical protein